MEIENLGPATARSTTTGSNSSASLATLSSDLDNFLTILTTQLQYQDPLSPMDTHEFTNQLVQFASVEQQIQSNSNLESLISLQQTNIMVGAVSYIGKDVEVSGQTTKLENGEAEFIYTMPEGAEAAILAIFDQNGTQVLFEQAETRAGRHIFSWDGRDSRDEALPDGPYTIQIVAADAEGNETIPDYAIRGTVKGVGVDDGVATLDLDGLNIPLANVVRVIEPEGESS